MAKALILLGIITPDLSLGLLNVSHSFCGLYTKYILYIIHFKQHRHIGNIG